MDTETGDLKILSKFYYVRSGFDNSLYIYKVEKEVDPQRVTLKTIYPNTGKPYFNVLIKDLDYVCTPVIDEEDIPLMILNEV